MSVALNVLPRIAVGTGPILVSGVARVLDAARTPRQLPSARLFFDEVAVLVPVSDADRASGFLDVVVEATTCGAWGTRLHSASVPGRLAVRSVLEVLGKEARDRRDRLLAAHELRANGHRAVRRLCRAQRGRRRMLRVA